MWRMPAVREVPATLPRPLTSFIGREQDIAVVESLLTRKDLRLLTLTGPGGGGKTRVAIRAVKDATAFPDGVWFISLAVRITVANRHDSTMFEELVDSIRPIWRPHRRPRKRPAKVRAGKGYDYRHCRQALTRWRITIRIARKGIESRQKLGPHRWVVERTLAWLNQFRGLTVRDKRRNDIHEAFLTLACGLLHFNAVQKFW